MARSSSWMKIVVIRSSNDIVVKRNRQLNDGRERSDSGNLKGYKHLGRVCMMQRNTCCVFIT